jgi:hypothetical protein
MLWIRLISIFLILMGLLIHPFSTVLRNLVFHKNSASILRRCGALESHFTKNKCTVRQFVQIYQGLI